MTERFYKYMFLVAALWNVLWGVFGVVFTRWTFALANLAFPELFAYYYTCMALVIAYGIGLFMVFRDMYGNRSLIIVGIIGKVSYAIIFLYFFIALPGKLPLSFLIPVIGDLVFVALFGLFLNFASTLAKETPEGAV